MTTSYDVVLAFTFVVLVATYVFTRNVAAQENYCPADKDFPNNMTPPHPVDELIYVDDGIIVCTKELCHLTTHSTLEKYYGNLFFDPIKVTPDERFIIHADGDRCCPTNLITRRYEGLMKDSSDVEYNIIVLPGTNGRNDYARYQHVTEGHCIPNSKCTLTGKGCHQMYRPQPLLARKKGDSIGKLAFYQFYVPSYCTCVNKHW